ISIASQLRDFRQIGRVVRALAENGVAVHTVVFVPDILARRDGGRDVMCVGEFGELPVRVNCQPQKYQCGDRSRADGEKARLSLVHLASLKRRYQTSRSRRYRGHMPRQRPWRRARHGPIVSASVPLHSLRFLYGVTIPTERLVAIGGPGLGGYPLNG